MRRLASMLVVAGTLALTTGAAARADDVTPQQTAAANALAQTLRQPALLVSMKVGENDARLEALRALPNVDLGHGPDVNGEVLAVVRGGTAALDPLRAGGFPVRVISNDLTTADANDRMADAAYARETGGTSPLPTGRTSYRTLDEIDTEITKLVAENPATVKPVNLPLPSFEGRHIRGIEIAKDVRAGGSSARPAILVDGVTHAREWPTVEVALEFAHDLTSALRRRDPRITKLLTRARVVIVPVINPDGYQSSRSFAATDLLAVNPETGINLIVGSLPPSGGALAYRRDTCSGSLPKWVPCWLQTGVDANRNYSVFWGGDGASSLPIEQDYRGPHPYSETEVENVRRLSNTLNATVRISLHTVAAKILLPPSKVDGKAVPGDAKLMDDLADAMTAATGYPNFTGPGLGYDTVGDSNDFGYFAAGQLSYTVELGPTGGNFHGPYEESVVQQYTGHGDTAGKGVREALLRAVDTGAKREVAGRIQLKAPRGTRFELRRTVRVPTSEVCSVAIGLPGLIGVNSPLECISPTAALVVDEPISMRAAVPKTKKTTWSVPPSTRALEQIEGRTAAYELRCTAPGGKARRVKSVTIARGQLVKVSLKRC